MSVENNITPAAAPGTSSASVSNPILAPASSSEPAAPTPVNNPIPAPDPSSASANSVTAAAAPGTSSAPGNNPAPGSLPASATPTPTKASPRIVFMGTPEFAVASLDAILRAGYPVVGVITAPDKPSGRGLQLNESAVKKSAMEKGLTILQPEKLKNPDFLETLRALRADLQIVVAFRMLPELVWNMPPMGTVNLHGSLLPQYRGAAPINWAVINGEKETGVTTFKLQHDIDTGNILLQDRFPIGEKDTAGEVHDRMKEIGAQLLVHTIAGLTAGTLVGIPQDNTAILQHAPKIFTETSRIDWQQSFTSIYNLIRGLSPFPAAFTELDGKLLKIYHAEMDAAPPTHAPGTYDTDKRTYLRFATPDGYIRVTDIQLEGKKRMKIEDFLRGYKFNTSHQP